MRHASQIAGPAGGGSVSADPHERHLTPKEISELWQLDVSTVRRIFQDEPGVLKLGKDGRRDGKRDYMTLRIPDSIFRRVYAERTR